MKTCRSTINAYFLSSSAVIALTLLALLLPELEPYRDALSATLGLASHQLWILAVPLSLAILLALSIRLKSKLCQPIQTLGEQCAQGAVVPDNAYGQLRELRIVRDFVCLTQERANSRAEQITRMESDLHSTRKRAERHLRRVEELEDLVESYARIRNELNYDLSLLRQENKNQEAQISALERELSKYRTRASDTSVYLGGQ